MLIHIYDVSAEVSEGARRKTAKEEAQSRSLVHFLGYLPPTHDIFAIYLLSPVEGISNFPGRNFHFYFMVSKGELVHSTLYAPNNLISHGICKCFNK